MGNPNAGKSTIFNHLTNADVHTGNFGGVTVDAFTKKVVYNGAPFFITDLPGIYSLVPSSRDEQNAVDQIAANEAATYVNVIDINSIQKSLALTLDLLSRGLKVVLLCNFLTVAKKRGLSVDFLKLGQILGVPVVVFDGDKNKLRAKFFDTIATTARLPKSTKFNIPADNYAQKQKQIKLICAQVILTPPSRAYAYGRLDKILLNKFLGIPLFLLVMLTIFWLTFGAIGGWLSDFVVAFWGYLCGGVRGVLVRVGAPNFVTSFFNEAIMQGLGGVLGFLPQIALLWLCLEFLEQSGYVARLVWLVEPLMSRLGLSGRSIFSLLLGFGCTTLALPTVDAISSKRAKIKTALLLPLVSCNAKMPILGCVAGALFFEHQTLAIFLLYLLGVVLAIAIAQILQILVPTKINAEIVEFVPLRLPKARELVKKTGRTVAAFLHKIWGVILCFSIVIWFLNNFTPALTPVSGEEKSLLNMLAQIVAPVFAPLGWDWGVVVALIVGIVAKEMILSSIAVLNGAWVDLPASLIDPASIVHFDLVSGVAFLVFCLLYTPCISALSQLRAVLPRRIFALFIVVQIGIAYLCAWLAGLCARCVVAGGWLNLFWVISLAITVFCVLIFGLNRFFASKRCANCKICNRR